MLNLIRASLIGSDVGNCVGKDMRTHFRLGGEAEKHMRRNTSLEGDLTRQTEKLTDQFMVETFGKLIFDKVFASAALVFFAPFIVVIALLLSAEGKGPVLFSHRRIGKGGRAFPCWKFRTMVADAEECLQKHLDANPDAKAEWESHRKLSNDPRVTCLGRFLRKTSLDELPQFWNVLCGDMSLVGPRPITQDEMRYYGDRIDYYLAVRPGITGLWQVSGRSTSGYEDRVKLDVEYVKTRSLRKDLQIVIKTVWVVLSQDGAC